MKLTRSLLILALLLATMVAAAQDLTETTTVGILTVSHPEGYIVQEARPGAFAVVDPTDSYAVLIFTGDSVDFFGFPEGVLARDLMDHLPDDVEITGEVEDINLPNGEGGVVQANVPDGGDGYLFAVDIEGGLLVGFAVSRDGDLSEEFKEIAQAILGTVIVGEAETPAPTETPEPEPTDEPDTTGETSIDGETCPIEVADMPEHTLIFCLGAMITALENWTLTDGTTELDAYATLNREGFTVSDSITVSEISEFYNPEIYIRDTLPFIAESMGHTTFDPAEHVTTAIDVEGLKAVFYNPSEFVEPADEDTVRMVVFVVTLNNDIFVTHIFTWVPSFAGEGVEMEIEQIVMSTALADFYDGTPAMIEIDGETLFFKTARWFDTTLTFRFNEEASFIVVCPPGGAGDEAVVWGTDIYTNDSSVCLAAAHAGEISLSDGGTVLVTMLPGQDSYTGSTRNGVTTSDYPAWNSSFSVEAFDLP